MSTSSIDSLRRDLTCLCSSRLPGHRLWSYCGFSSCSYKESPPYLVVLVTLPTPILSDHTRPYRVLAVHRFQFNKNVVIRLTDGPATDKYAWQCQGSLCNLLEVLSQVSLLKARTCLHRITVLRHSTLSLTLGTSNWILGDCYPLRNWIIPGRSRRLGHLGGTWEI